MSALRWREAGPGARDPVERWLAGDARGSRILARSARRELVRLDGTDGRPLLVKRFRTAGSGAGGIAGRAKAWLGWHPADREWRSLGRLASRGVAVAPALGLARLGRERILVQAYVEGRSLETLLGAPVAQRRAALAAVGRAIASMHRAGCVHGDLHVGNLLWTADGPVILDLQRARASRRRAARFADLGALDFSLRHNGFNLGDRLCVRRAALGLEGGGGRTTGARARRRDPDARAALRRVARAGARRARAYYASRTRRSTRPGRRFAALRAGAERGLRLRAIDESTVLEALAAHDRARLGQDTGEPRLEVVKRDHRSCIAAVRVGAAALVVKEVRKTGPLRRLADLFRGSPARRAWRAGHGLETRRIPCARPLAFVERRRFGVPVSSRIVLEDLRPSRAASDPSVWSAGTERPLDALGRLLRTLVHHAVDHGDLQALHVYLLEPDASSGKTGSDRLRPALIDLEGVRFPRRLGDRRRVRALAELNASLPEAFVPASDRRALFVRHARALPFAAPRDAVLQSVVQASLEREHHWSGEDCDASR